MAPKPLRSIWKPSTHLAWTKIVILSHFLRSKKSLEKLTFFFFWSVLDESYILEPCSIHLKQTSLFTFVKNTKLTSQTHFLWLPLGLGLGLGIPAQKVTNTRFSWKINVRPYFFFIALVFRYDKVSPNPIGHLVHHRNLVIEDYSDHFSTSKQK